MAHGVWIKPSTDAQSWGNNLVQSQFNDGQSQTFTFSQPLSSNNVYDIRLSGGGFYFIKFGISISNGMTITFTSSDLNNGSNLPIINIQNRSGKTFNSIHIKPSVISDWGSSFGSVSNNSNLSATILIPPSNHTVFDIQMRSTNPTNTYTRNNVTISQGVTLTFTSADADNPTIELPVIVIQNNTGYTMTRGYATSGIAHGVWIKPSTITSWENNLLNVLSDGQSQAFMLSQHLTTQNIYDIRISGGGFNFTKYNIIVSEGMIVTFSTNDLEQ